MSQLKITQIKSIIKTQEKQKRTIEALGLGHPNNVVIQPDNAQIRGMINVVRHLVHVEELTA
jgi:large subunit ribosomal protein L30